MVAHVDEKGVSLARPVSAGTCLVTLGLGMDLTGSGAPL